MPNAKLVEIIYSSHLGFHSSYDKAIEQTLLYFAIPEHEHVELMNKINTMLTNLVLKSESSAVSIER